MRSILKNRILRTGILGFFVLAVFLLPASIVFNTNLSEISPAPFTLEAGVASAAGLGIESFAIDALNSIFNSVGYFFLELTGLLTRTGGLLMETALNYTVFEMGIRVHEKSILGGTVGNLWSLIRDICNLAFIFGFIYIGIRTIIDPDSATMKRFLSRIIIGALLINFSLFFAKAIIDFSNFTAYQVYSSMTVGDGSISETIMSKLRLTTFYDTDSSGNLALKTAKSNSISYFIMAGIFLLITAFVFFAGALLLIVRFVSLVLIMVASPLLFAATVFPQTEHVAKDLWHKLFSYSFFAPLYILLILISIKIVDGIGIAGSFGADFTKSSVDNNLSAILNFTIVIFFMIFSLMIASKMGVAGGNMAVSIGNNLRNRGQRILTNSALYLPRAGARRAVGSASRRTLERFDRWQSRPQNQQSAVGRAARRVLALTDADRTVRDTLTAGTQVRAGLAHSYQNVRDYQGERTRRLNQGEANQLREEALNNSLANINNPGAALPAAVNQLATTIRAMSDAERAHIEFNSLQNSAVAVHLTDANIDALERSGEFSAQQIQQIRAARTQGRNNIAQHGNAGGADPRITPAYAAEQRQQLLSGSMAVVGALPHDVFVQPAMAQFITPSMIEERMRNGATPAQLALMRNNILNHITNPVTPPAVTNMWARWSRNTTYGAQFGLP